MIITITGQRKEIRRWIHRQERLTGGTINYVAMNNEDGSYTYLIKEDKNDYPESRIVRRIRKEL